MQLIPPLENYLIFMNVILSWIYWFIRFNLICDLLISSIELFQCDLFNFTFKILASWIPKFLMMIALDHITNFSAQSICVHDISTILQIKCWPTIAFLNVEIRVPQHMGVKRGRDKSIPGQMMTQFTDPYTRR